MSQPQATMTLEREYQCLDGKSSTESKLSRVDDLMPHMLWTRYIFLSQDNAFATHYYTSRQQKHNAVSEWKNIQF